MNLNLFAPAATSRVDAAPPVGRTWYYVAIQVDQYSDITFDIGGNWDLNYSLENYSGYTFTYSNESYRGCLAQFIYADEGSSIVNSIELPILELQEQIGKQIQLSVHFNNVDHVYTATDSNPIMTGYSLSDFEYFASSTYMDNTCRGLLVTISEIPQISITYKDAGGGAFSGTHASSYPARHTNGTATTLDTPTKTNYTFAGYYLNDPTCAASNLVTTLSAATEYETITLYAKWEPVVITITLTCSNYSEAAPNYMMYIYKNDTLTCQVVPTSATYQLKVLAPELATGDTYTVAFVFGYYGQFSATPTSGVEVNGRKLKITSFSNKTITYTLVTPRINSTVII